MSVHRSYHWQGDGRNCEISNELAVFDALGLRETATKGFPWSHCSREIDVSFLYPTLPILLTSISCFHLTLNVRHFLFWEIETFCYFCPLQRCYVSLRFCGNRKNIYFKTSISFLKFNVKYCSFFISIQRVQASRSRFLITFYHLPVRSADYRNRRSR